MQNKYKYFPLNINKSKNINIVKIFSKIVKYSSNVIFIVVYYLYFLSLEGCFEGEKKCSKKSKWIKKKTDEGLGSALIL